MARKMDGSNDSEEGSSTANGLLLFTVLAAAVAAAEDAEGEASHAKGEAMAFPRACNDAGGEIDACVRSVERGGNKGEAAGSSSKSSGICSAGERW